MRNIRLFASAATLAAAVLLVGTAPLAAQAPLDRPESTWSHDLSGLTLPMTLAGFERGQSKQYDDQGYNIGVTFRDEASGSWADLFIYKAAPASVAVWGDRAAAGMFANPMLGDVDLAAVTIASFTPPNGAGDNSGLMIVAPVKSELTASGLAIYIHDGWLVKLRMSSRALDAATMQARMAEFIAAVTLPAATLPAPAFTEISDCAVPLKAKKKAKVMRLDMMGTLMLGATLGVVHDKKLEQASADSGAAPDVWCRDAASQPRYGIYRREGSEDSYLIGIGDTGTSLSVGKYDLGPLIKPSRGFLVTQSDGVTEKVYPPFDRLPAPEQVLGLPGNIGPVFSAGLLPGDTGTTINVQTE
jgi:hypothetical protein